MKSSSRFALTTLMESFTRIVLAAIVLLSFHLIGSSPAAGQGLNLCSKTSQDVSKSCNSGVQDQYWITIGKCENLPTKDERKTCGQQAKQDSKLGSDGCKAQFAARQGICNTLGEAAYNPIINPADFVAKIDNPYLPLTPGTIYIYEGVTEKGNEHNEVYVTHHTNVILGVTCTVVKDTVKVDGVLAEDTIDWFAQDKFGNVWYFGENSLEYDGGLVVSLGGSWMAGVDGAKPGIVMKAVPQMGDLYRQEFALGVAEDMAQVIALNQSTTVPAGTFDHCVETKDFSPLEPDVVEHKFYAPGVGNVQTVDASTGKHLDLINIITE